VALLSGACRSCVRSLLFAAAVGAGPAFAQPLEYEVKAAFLYNFAQFTEWPAEAFAAPDEPFRMCVAGANGFVPSIERAVAGERVAERRILVDRLADNENAGRCHILFIPRSANQRTAALVRLGARALLVGESADFLDRGGMINFVIDGGRVRFDINAAAASARGLRMSSRLLRIARHTNIESQP
jgi:hypothetical protein